MKNNLQKLRWQKGWSQDTLALYSGITKTTINHIENEQSSNPKVYTALLLAKALHVKVEDIFAL